MLTPELKTTMRARVEPARPVKQAHQVKARTGRLRSRHGRGKLGHVLLRLVHPAAGVVLHPPPAHGGEVEALGWLAGDQKAHFRPAGRVRAQRPLTELLLRRPRK